MEQIYTAHFMHLQKCELAASAAQMNKYSTQVHNRQPGRLDFDIHIMHRKIPWLRMYIQTQTYA